MRAGMLLFAVIFAALLTDSVYGKDPPLPPPDPERGSIGLTVNVRPPFGPKSAAVLVYFARLNEPGEMFTAVEVIPSNYSKKDQVYLLNAEPGRYVAVAARLPGVAGPGAAYRVYESYFPKDMIAATEVTVQPGKMVFAGNFLSKSSVDISEADEAQAHYLRLISPDAANTGAARRILGLSGKTVYRDELLEADRSRETELAFWAEAKEKEFKDEPAWVAAIDRQSETSSSDAPVADEAPEQVTLVDPQTGKPMTCPEGLFEPRRMTADQASQERAWHAEFQRTHNRLPTPLEGCVRVYEILGYEVTTAR